MCSNLRVSRHPRGHVAACNGRVELVRAKAVPYEEEEDAVRLAVLAEARAREERERKERRLQSFQREVRERVRRKEKRRQIQAAVNADVAARCEQRAAERAVNLEAKTQEATSLLHRTLPDVEDAAISGHRVGSTGSDGCPSASQMARRNLLAQTSQKPTVISVNTQLSPQLTENDRRDMTRSSGNSLEKSSVHSTVTNAGQLAEVERRKAGQQYLLFRRLYSDLEREQVRERRQRQAHNERVQQLKRAKEVDRREAELEMMDVSTASTETMEEERQKAREWAETVALEERRHRLRKVKENERYIDALRATLRQRLSQQRAKLPPLCSCGTTVWDSGPYSCANNCVFYRNPGAYRKALSNLLSTLDK